MNQLYNDLRWAYHNATLSWKEYRELVDLVRSKFAYESLIGVKQVSIFDESLTDENFVEYISK